MVHVSVYGFSSIPFESMYVFVAAVVVVLCFCAGLKSHTRLYFDFIVCLLCECNTSFCLSKTKNTV